MRWNRIVAVLICGVTIGFTQQPRKPAPSAAAAQSATTKLPSTEVVNGFLKHSFGHDPSVAWKIAAIRPSEVPGIAEVIVLLNNPQGQQTTKLYVTPDGEHAIAGDMVPFGADPYARARNQLARQATGATRGAQKSGFVIVEFGDLQCPSCKQAQPVIDKLVSETPAARFVFENFPLMQIHDWSFKAATYADCVAREDNQSFWKFLQSVYDDQSNINRSDADEKLSAHAAQAGVAGPATAACAARPETNQPGEPEPGAGKIVGRKRHAHPVHQRPQDRQRERHPLRALEGDCGLRSLTSQVISSAGLHKQLFLI